MIKINLHSIYRYHPLAFTGNIIKQLLVGCLFLIIPFIGISQSTHISGKIIDSETKEPVPFANIILTKSLQGTLTDFDGNYQMDVRSPRKRDSLSASLIGYKKTTMPIIHGKTQTINFELISHNERLPEVTITYEGNPADAIVDSIIKYKEINSFRAYTVCQYDSYTKASAGLNNLSEEVFDRKLLEPFEFIGNYKDTSELDGQTYTPAMISESRSTIYKRISPPSKKEIITASRISGLNHTNISQFFGNLTMEIDIYENHLDLFDKNFVSPISKFGHDYYRYYLIDSAFIDDKWCYHLNYKQKRKLELSFSGDFWVTDSTWAIVEMNMRLPDDVNLNFVNDMLIEQEFRWTNNQFWMNTKDRIVIDFNIVRNSNSLIGAYGVRSNYFDNFIFDSIDSPGVFKGTGEVVVKEDALKLEDSYWEAVRPDSLTSAEAGIYEMVDSVKSSPSFKKYKTIALGLVTGYFPLGKFEIGPYFKLISYNSIEGVRLRLGGRTTNKLNKKFRIGGYLAYGTYDNRFKYGADFIYVFNKFPRRSLTASYKYDLEQLGLSATGRPTDNILSSFFSRGPIDKLTMIREYNLAYEYEWYNGLINTLHLNRKELFPPNDTKFVLYPESRQDTVLKNSITTTEIGIDTRISFDEKVIERQYSRMSIKGEKPIITIRYRFGIPHASVNDYNYHKLSVNINQWFNLGTIGWSRFNVDLGKIWGTLPYPLLKIHDGNETWLFNQYSSNLMNYYEFVSDQYVSLYYTHHFLGFFLNKVPLIRRLNMREVVHFRALYGSLRPENLEFSEFPGNLRPFGDEPYLEAGVGLENILKFFRIDAIWRLTHLNDPGSEPASKFGVFASVYFSF